jgi:hypothetical protein
MTGCLIGSTKNIRRLVLLRRKSAPVSRGLIRVWTGMGSLDSFILGAVDTLEIASSLAVHRPADKPKNDVVSIEVELAPRATVGAGLGLQ